MGEYLIPTCRQLLDEWDELSILELDQKGRLLLPKKIRDSLGIGRKVLVINAGDHLKVVPLPSDPFAVLHGAFNTEKSFTELRRGAERTARAELSRGGNDPDAVAGE